MSKAHKIGDITRSLLLLCLSWVIPKKGSIVVFATRDRHLSGNMYHLFRYCDQRGYTCFQVYGRCIKNMQTGMEGQQRWDLLMTVSKAAVVFAEYNVSHLFVSGFLQWMSRVNVVQLWHGTGFKKIALHDLDRKGLFGRLRYLDKKARFRSYRLITATSEADRRRKADSFNNPNVRITGSPRNDLLFEKRSGSGALKAQGASAEGDNQAFLILYAPTYRDASGTFEPFSKDFWVKLNQHLQRLNGIFYIRRHPNEKERPYSVPAGLKRVVDISEREVDVQDLLIETDLLVTDYSSISTDFSLLSRPILFYMPDLEQYRQESRDFYYDIPEILPGPCAYSEDDLMEKLFDLSWFESQEYQELYGKFKEMFHAYSDGGSRERIMNLVQSWNRNGANRG